MAGHRRLWPIGLLAGAVSAEAVLVHLGRTYGSTAQERASPLPGDGIILSPCVVTDHAVTIDAPPDFVWPWLVQLGWGRGGWYTARWVDRLLFPSNGPSADRIIPELQQLRVGDFIADGPPHTECGLVVELLEPNQALVLHSSTHLPRSWRARAEADWSWVFVLTGLDGGGRTRFLFRSRWTSAPWWLTAASRLGIVPADFVMSRSMLRGVKRRSERLHRSRAGRSKASAQRSVRRLAACHPTVDADPEGKDTVMAVIVQRTRPKNPAGLIPLPAPRLRVVAAATALAGVALAVLAGRDGTLGWQLARVAGVVVLIWAVLAVEARLCDRGCGRVAAGLGVVAFAVDLGFMPSAVEEGLSVEAVAGTVATAAGVILAAAGTIVASRGRRTIWRIGAGTGAVIILAGVAFVVGPAVAATNVPRPEIGATPSSEGLDYESVTVTTDDGVRLAGWYLPSTNRAAVVLLHGAGSTRSSVLDEAAVLARHGFGVLMIDARGHGDSAGRAMDFGWHGDADSAAATRYLADRPGVDVERIGVVGMSMGGEEAVGATATNPQIGAVVAEGATARNAADEAWLSDQFGVRGFVQEQLERLQDFVTDALTDASVPTSMRGAVAASGDTLGARTEAST